MPAYGRLLAGLMGDERVSLTDKALVVGAVAYIASPFDFTSAIPIVGEIDDLFIVLLALQHLVANADADVVLEHWHGDIEELEHLDLRRALMAAAFFLPKRLRRRLRVIGRVD
ncbi:MAG TPA: YkvA family protein [Gemmatimonadaceae bacterium]|nr:YkvA family protein [Gemmatimonadaceae bacterium]